MPVYACRRLGNDKGRSVQAKGYWGDILNSPYHCYGTHSEDDSMFKVTNKQFEHTAMDVAELNVLVRVCMELDCMHVCKPITCPYVPSQQLLHVDATHAVDLPQLGNATASAELSYPVAQPMHMQSVITHL